MSERAINDNAGGYNTTSSYNPVKTMGAELDDYILRILVQAVNNRLRFCEIRNQALCDMGLEVTGRDLASFSAKVHKRLKVLCRQGLVTRDEQGHQNTFYVLAQDAEEKYFKVKSGIAGMTIGLGTHRPGDTYQEWKTRVLKNLNEYVEKEILRKEWKNFTSHSARRRRP
jgi:hypothetical protein